MYAKVINVKRSRCRGNECKMRKRISLGGQGNYKKKKEGEKEGRRKLTTTCYYNKTCNLDDIESERNVSRSTN